MAAKLERSTLWLAIFVFALTAWANASFWIGDPDLLVWLPPFRAGVDLNRNSHLGAEYLRIAEALVAGKGFSNPFGIETGPTAWMPPVYPLLLAALLWLLPGKAWVVGAILLLKNGVLIWTGVCIRDVARRTSVRLGEWVALGLYALWLAAYFHWFFQLTHDTWLLLALVTATFAFALRVREDRAPRVLGLDWRWSWGALGGVTLLSSPIAGFAWGAVSLFLGLRRPALWRPLAAALGVAMLLLSVWVVRNAIVFDRLVLVKSNFYFDLYFANYVNPDGVYDHRFFLAHHPLFTVRRGGRFPYQELGEMAFMDRYREAFARDFAQAPGLYVRKARARLLAATLVHRPYRPEVTGPHPLLPTAVHVLPVAGLLLAALFREERARAALGVAAVAYGSYLLPYVAVAFYSRYLLPLSAILVLFVFWGADAVASWSGTRRSEGRAPHSM